MTSALIDCKNPVGGSSSFSWIEPVFQEDCTNGETFESHNSEHDSLDKATDASSLHWDENVISNPFDLTFERNCGHAISDVEGLIEREVADKTPRLLEKLNFASSELEMLREKVLARTRLLMISDQSMSERLSVAPTAISGDDAGEVINEFARTDAGMLLTILREQYSKIPLPQVAIDERGRVTFDWQKGDKLIQWTIAECGGKWPLLRVYEYQGSLHRLGGKVLVFHNPISLFESLNAVFVEP